MSRVSGNKSTAPKKGGSSMLTGMLLGMVFGVALAAGLAWLLLKSPSPFVNKEQVVKPAADVVAPRVEVVKPRVDPAVPPAGEEDKPRFEFYKVLTDKQDATADSPKVEKTEESKPPVAAKESYLQAGAFANLSDAENLKATLAMKGLEAGIQTVMIPGRGEMHRVRLGPLKNEQEVSSVRGTLKLNGLEATLTH